MFQPPVLDGVEATNSGIDPSVVLGIPVPGRSIERPLFTPWLVERRRVFVFLKIPSQQQVHAKHKYYARQAVHHHCFSVHFVHLTLSGANPIDLLALNVGPGKIIYHKNNTSSIRKRPKHKTKNRLFVILCF